MRQKKNAQKNMYLSSISSYLGWWLKANYNSGSFEKLALTLKKGFQDLGHFWVFLQNFFRAIVPYHI